MSSVIVIAFDNPDTAQQVVTQFKDLEKRGALHLTDARVVVKDADGKLVVKDEAGHPIRWGAIAGGILGGLFFIMMPVVGIFAGAAAGAVIAKSIHGDAVDKKFIDDVAAALKTNSSAVFLQVADEYKSVVVNALEPYKGTLIQTTLSPEAEEAIKKSLE